VPGGDEIAPPLVHEKGEVSKAKAVEVCKAFLKGCGIGYGGLPVEVHYEYKQGNSIGNIWVVRFARVMDFYVDAQTGKVTNFVYTKKAQEVSDARMKMGRKAALTKPRLPTWKTLPSVMLLSPDSKLVKEDLTPTSGVENIGTGWYIRCHAIEWPGGKPIVNAPVEIWTDFDPRDGSLIGFSRSGGVRMPNASPKVSASKAQAIAKSKEASAELRPGRPSIKNCASGPKPGLACQTGERGRPDRSKPLVPIWIVTLKNKELWINGVTGNLLGGRRFAPPPARTGQSSRVGGG